MTKETAPKLPTLSFERLQSRKLRRILGVAITATVGGGLASTPVKAATPKTHTEAFAYTPATPSLQQVTAERRVSLQELQQARIAASRSLARKALVAHQTAEARAAAAAKAAVKRSPASPTPMTTATQSTQAARVADSTLSTWLQTLGACESGNNPATNTGNGYYGTYQFSLETWDSLGAAITHGYARPDLAPAVVQDEAVIDNTKRSAGLITQNPGCYEKTGISNYPPA